MNRDIVIFGKNSVLAQNYLNSLKNSKDNKILITRKSNYKDDIVFNTSDLLSDQNLNRICSEINYFSKFNEKIFILFSWSGVPRSLNKKVDEWNINQNITLNFLNIARILRPKRIIFISSAGSVYPKNINKIFNESDQTLPSNSYGERKLLSESMIRNFTLENKIKHTILRIASAYGYDNRFSDQGVINKWLYNAINNEILKLYNSKNSVVNFISFDQISNALKKSIEEEINGTFNIGSIKSVSLEKIIFEIEKITNKKLNFEIINEERRNFRIDTKKFYDHTGVLFENEISKNISFIYKSIMNNAK